MPFWHTIMEEDDDTDLILAYKDFEKGIFPNFEIEIEGMYFRN